MFRRDRLIKDVPAGKPPLPRLGPRRIFCAMTDAPDLARRFLSLWEDYLTALLSDPSEVEVLQCWVKAGSAFIHDPGPSDRQSGPPADAASAAGPIWRAR